LRILNVLDRLHIVYGKPLALRFGKEVIVDSIKDLARCIRKKKVTAWNLETH